MAREGHREEAEPHYRKAVALDPSYKDALLDLAFALRSQSPERRKRSQSTENFPQTPELRSEWARCCSNPAMPPTPLPRSKRPSRNPPTPPPGSRSRKPTCRKSSRPRPSRLAALVLAATPQDTELRMFYARLLRDQRKFSEAAAQFQAVTQTKPDSVAAWNELAGVYLVDEKYPQALAAFDHVRELGAETTANFFFRAVAYDHLHQAKDALENYNRFLAGSQGSNPDQEFQARQRVRVLEKELGKR